MSKNWQDVGESRRFRGDRVAHDRLVDERAELEEVGGKAKLTRRDGGVQTGGAKRTPHRQQAFIEVGAPRVRRGIFLGRPAGVRLQPLMVVGIAPHVDAGDEGDDGAHDAVNNVAPAARGRGDQALPEGLDPAKLEHAIATLDNDMRDDFVKALYVGAGVVHHRHKEVDNVIQLIRGEVLIGIEVFSMIRRCAVWAMLGV